MEYRVAETDWLASNSIFYNENTGKIADNINEVIDYNNVEIHPEGLNNYLNFGYSVFGQTVVKNVKFLLPNSVVYKNQSGKVIVKEKEDPVEKKIHISGNCDEVWEYFSYIINRKLNENKKKIVLPLSGGYDSRLLAYFCHRKEDVKAYTYGISAYDENCYEVIYAKEIAERLGIDWKLYSFQNYHKYFELWDNLYGVATHAHGMYHMEFYDMIRKELSAKEALVVSGIMGDAWAGSVVINKIEDIKDLDRLGYTHRICIDESVSNYNCDYELREAFFEKNRDKLLDPDWNVIFAMRNKMMLLSYLFKVPQLFGFDTYCPYLNIDLAMKMVNLPWRDKKERKWQKKFIHEHQLEIQGIKKGIDFVNMCDLKNLKNNPLQPLNVKLLREVVDSEYIEWVNKEIMRKPIIYGTKSTIIGKIKNLSFMCYNQKIIKAYTGYLLLRPIENLLRSRR